MRTHISASMTTAAISHAERQERARQVKNPKPGEYQRWAELDHHCNQFRPTPGYEYLPARCARLAGHAGLHAAIGCRPNTTSPSIVVEVWP